MNPESWTSKTNFRGYFIPCIDDTLIRIYFSHFRLKSTELKSWL